MVCIKAAFTWLAQLISLSHRGPQRRAAAMATLALSQIMSPAHVDIFTHHNRIGMKPGNIYIYFYQNKFKLQQENEIRSAQLNLV